MAMLGYHSQQNLITGLLHWWLAEWGPLPALELCWVQDPAAEDLSYTIMDCVGAMPHAWFLCLQYVTFFLNLTCSPQIKSTPLFALTSSTNDISMLLYFYFWQPVYFRNGESGSFPSESKVSHSHFVGLANHVGHAMTFKVLADDFQKVSVPFCHPLCHWVWGAELASWSSWWGATFFCEA